MNFSVKHKVPNFAAHTEPCGPELIVVLQMVNLLLLNECTVLRVPVVEGVVEQVIHLVADQVANQKWKCYFEGQKPGHWLIEENVQSDMSWNWREDKPISIHREAVMNTMNGVMERIHKAGLWHVTHPGVFPMEEESVQCVLCKGPE